MLNQQYTAEQEKVVRDLIAQLKFHLSKFNEEQKDGQAGVGKTGIEEAWPECMQHYSTQPKAVHKTEMWECQGEEDHDMHETHEHVHHEFQCDEPAPDMDLLIN